MVTNSRGGDETCNLNIKNHTKGENRWEREEEKGIKERWILGDEWKKEKHGNGKRIRCEKKKEQKMRKH